jgi:hypothetical protein
MAAVGASGFPICCIPGLRGPRKDGIRILSRRKLMKQKRESLVRWPVALPRRGPFQFFQQMAMRAAVFCLVALPILLLAPPAAASAFVAWNEFWGMAMIYMPANLPSPQLQIAASSDNVILSWPVLGSNFVVETTGDSTQAGGWTNSSVAPDLAGDAATVTLPVTNAQQFFRLKGPPYIGLIPVFQFAIFYNSLLEFSTCQTMTVREPLNKAPFSNFSFC